MGKELYAIHLHSMQFFARHGVHEEEALTGNNFEVSLDVYFPGNKKIVHLHDTVNYAAVYEVVNKHFQHPVKLLETLAVTIIDEIAAMDKRISTINITIMKLTAPIPNFTGKAGVSVTKNY